ncbi:MAG TPA: MgtC/SapB family protein [Bacteroidia bacterium]|jgi:putative Mg2+ transporter-C (MgtC) family protein|nr:MgtC/SapB family protein [Bacteroidia bacterium]
MNFEHFHEDLIKLSIAVLIGGVIGAEREYRTKSAGFRTIILVTVGSALFTIFSIRIGGENPDRIAANIITGIGFLGAGAIFRGENKLSGITTAAIIWAASALGMGVGSGEYVICLATTAVIFLILVLFTKVERFIDRKNQSRTYRISTRYEDRTLLHYEDLFSKTGLIFRRGKQTIENNIITGTWELQGSEANHKKLTEELLRDRSILSFDF